MPQPSTVRARPHRLLVNLMGSYWRVHDIHISSMALVGLLAEFGVSEATARAALSRLSRRELLRRSKVGRRTYYVLTAGAVRLLDAGASRMFKLGENANGWDGTWTLVLFSLGGESRETRHLLHSRLRWLTFAPLYDRAWVSPHARESEATDLLRQLDLQDYVVIRTAQTGFGDASYAHLTQAWDLTELAARYETYIERYRPLLKRAQHGDISEAEALVARTELTDDWRHFARDDPDLPVDFLPENFPREEAREIFLSAYDLLEEKARRRFDQLVTPDEPGSNSQ